MQLYLLDIIKGKRKGIIPWVIRCFLFVISLGYQAAVRCRNFAFDRQWISTSPSPASLTISIGNITVGGTGKTPLTLMLAQELSSCEQMAILSRGYHSKAEKLSNPIILSRGLGPLYSPEYAGDEPYLLAKKLKKCMVIVGRNRCKAAEIAVNAGAKVLILDDGFQHRYLRRDFDIVIMDGRDPFSKGRFLPYGLLRDECQSIKRAHLIILNRIQDVSHYDELKDQLRVYTEAPVMATSLEVKQIHLFEDKFLSSIKEKKIAIFCGIANPERFIKTVQDLGAHIVHQKILMDHQGFGLKELHAFAVESAKQGAEYIFCTEKDYVKLPLKSLYDSGLPLPIGWLEMQMKVQYGAEHWRAFIEKARVLLAGEN